MAPLGIAIAVCSGAIMVLPERRHYSLAGLLLQYIAAFLLAGVSLGWTLSVAKLIAGIISVAILTFSLRERLNDGGQNRFDLIDRPLFRGGVLLLVLAAGWGIGRTAWLQIPALEVGVEIGGTILLTLGLLMAAFYDDPLRAGLGILTCLSGFEVVYAGIEPSLAILALLAGVQISIAMVIGFLLQIPDPHQGRSS